MRLHETIGRRLLAVVLVAGPGAVSAADYPVKTVRIVVPFAAGGSTDLLARNVAQRLSEAWKQPVIVDNRAGGGGIIGADHAAKSPPDGYTLLLGTVTTHGVAPTLYPKLPFDAIRDFAAVVELASIPQLLSVHPSIPVRSFKEFLALARAKPGALNFGTGGQGSASHMAAELLMSMAKIRMVHVPYKGTGPAMSELLGGHLSLMFDVVMTSLPHAKAGRLRSVGISSLTRSEVIPDVPTLHESGMPGFEALVWFGLFAPAGAPPDIVRRINEETVRALRQPKMREILIGQGIDVVAGTPQEFTARVKDEVGKWGKVIRDAGIKLD
jgi:tripartite-type tricarboxylate transporter receptor subunit TctC